MSLPADEREIYVFPVNIMAGMYVCVLSAYGLPAMKRVALNCRHLEMHTFGVTGRVDWLLFIQCHQIHQKRDIYIINATYYTVVCMQ
jgi:hypothetical protein